MRFPSISPLMCLGMGISVSVGSLFLVGRFDPYVTFFFFLAAITEIIARKQKKIPSVLISFVASLVIIVFIKTNIIDFLKLYNTSLEPDIHKGAVVIYQPNFYRVEKSNLVIIKEYSESRNLLCKVLGESGQSYQLEIISRKQIIEVSKDNLKGKIIYIANNRTQ